MNYIINQPNGEYPQYIDDCEHSGIIDDINSDMTVPEPYCVAQPHLKYSIDNLVLYELGNSRYDTKGDRDNDR